MQARPLIEGLAPDQRARVAAALQRRAASGAGGAPRPRDPSERIPLSSSQLRLWFLQQWQPDAPTFNAVRAYRLRGGLDVVALDRAVDTVMQRHESLRTVFVSRGGVEPEQVVLEHEAGTLGQEDLSAVAPAEREDRLQARLRELAREPFDLAADRMLRATLVRLAADDHVLLLRMHHICGDAFSMTVMCRELGHLYDAFTQGRSPDLAPPPIQMGDFAIWQRRRLQGRRLADLTGYWVGQLEGAPPLLALPTVRARPAVQRHEGAHERFTLDGTLADAVDALAREERATMYIVTLAAFAVLLYRVGGEDDVVVGSPIANRTHAELGGVIGFLSNTVALRVRLAGNPSFREVVGRTREVVLGALANQEMPFEQVVSALRLPRDAGHNPLFQVNFRAQATPPPVPEMAGLAVEPVSVDIGFSRFDLALELQRSPDGIDGYMEYDLDLFDGELIRSLIAAFEQLLQEAVADPDASIVALAVPPVHRPRERPGPTRGRRRVPPQEDPE